MRKLIIIMLLLVLTLSAVGCAKAREESKGVSSVNIEELKQSYPEYFEMADFKGIEIYVWQIAEDSYRCGMMSGTNRNKTYEEISALQFKSLSIKEAKAILAEIGVEEEDIIVVPISQAYSSYFYKIDDAYKQKVAELFKSAK